MTGWDVAGPAGEAAAFEGEGVRGADRGCAVEAGAGVALVRGGEVVKNRVEVAKAPVVDWVAGGPMAQREEARMQRRQSIVWCAVDWELDVGSLGYLGWC